MSDLVTNSLGRSFPPKNGRVSVNLDRNTDGCTVLTISDNGVIPAEPVSASVGETDRRMRVIKGLLRQIDGALTMHDENGSRSEIVFAKRGVLE